MAAEIHITAEAQADIDDAYDWYEEQRVGLGEDFLHCVDACIYTVTRMPEAFPVVYRHYRRVMVRRFPYAVIYESNRQSVTVFSVFHTSRDPEKWQSRLP